LTAGVGAGFAGAAGFFTVTGSFDGLENAHSMGVAPRGIRWPRGFTDSTSSGCSPMANPGVIPPNSARKRTHCCAASHTPPGKDGGDPVTGARLYREMVPGG
jgi:hypothetical protein